MGDRVVATNTPFELFTAEADGGENTPAGHQAMLYHSAFTNTGSYNDLYPPQDSWSTPDFMNPGSDGVYTAPGDTLFTVPGPPPVQAPIDTSAYAFSEEYLRMSTQEFSNGGGIFPDQSPFSWGV